MIRFRSITVFVVVSLAVLAGLQLFWVLRLGAAYDELARREVKTNVNVRQTDGEPRKQVIVLTITSDMKRQTAGLVATSIATVLLLALTLGYLLRTLFRQKTLEEMRVDFTHNITHELKTPIAVAYAAGDALLNFGADDDPRRREKYLRVVLGQLDTLSGMVERILAISLEDDLSLSVERVPLRAVVERLVEANEPRGQFIVDVPADSTVRADPMQLAIALGNLVDNALKYSGRQPLVTIRARQGVISVTDNGPGIPSTLSERVFEKFYRIPTGDLHPARGFGLGLYNVRRIAERHGGWARVDGSTFTLYFPDDGAQS